MRKVILLGYMGCGKSTIAKMLSKKIEMPFFDLDNCIEINTQLSISTLFKEKGEIYFRKLEHETFNGFIQKEESFILSLGGGTPCYANNHELLNGENIVSIYLKASVGTLHNRLIAGKAKRPLVAQKSDEELKEFIAKQLFERSFYYHHANHKVNVDGKSAMEIVLEIEKLLT